MPNPRPEITVRFEFAVPDDTPDLEAFMDALLGKTVTGPTGEAGRIVYVVPKLPSGVGPYQVVVCEAEFDADGDIGRYLRRDALRGVSAPGSIRRPRVS